MTIWTTSPRQETCENCARHGCKSVQGTRKAANKRHLSQMPTSTSTSNMSSIKQGLKKYHLGRTQHAWCFLLSKTLPTPRRINIACAKPTALSPKSMPRPDDLSEMAIMGRLCLALWPRVQHKNKSPNCRMSRARASETTTCAGVDAQPLPSTTCAGRILSLGTIGQIASMRTGMYVTGLGNLRKLMGNERVIVFQI